MRSQLTVSLHDEEAEFLQEAAEEAGVSRQSLLRAFLSLAHDHDDLLSEVQEAAQSGRRIEPEERPAAGQTKGLRPRDYRRAIAEAGTLSGAARILDVSRTSVREAAIRHDIPVESIGGVPE
jgi:hypothetical protein